MSPLPSKVSFGASSVPALSFKVDTALVKTAKTDIVTGSANLPTAGAIADKLADIVTAQSIKDTTDQTAMRTEYQAADAILQSAISAIQSSLSTGLTFKGSIADLTALGAITEASVQPNFSYYVRSTNDMYVVVDETDGDYKPTAWTTKSFVKHADFTELSGLVFAEATKARANELALKNFGVSVLLNTTNSFTTIMSSLSNGNMGQIRNHGLDGSLVIGTDGKTITIPNPPSYARVGKDGLVNGMVLVYKTDTDAIWCDATVISCNDTSLVINLDSADTSLNGCRVRVCTFGMNQADYNTLATYRGGLALQTYPVLQS